MAQGVAYGTSSADKTVRFFRLKSDHTIIQQPKSVGDSEFTGITDAEFASKIIGNIQVSPQDDGSNQIQMTCAAWGADILDFINNYKNVEAAGDKTAFTAFHGEDFGGSGSTGTADQLIAVIHGAPDPDTSKIMGLVFACSIDPASTGGFTIEPDNVAQVQLTLNQVKPKADIVIHDGTSGTPSVFNGAVVSFAAETTDIKMLTDSYKFHFPVTAV